MSIKDETDSEETIPKKTAPEELLNIAGIRIVLMPTSIGSLDYWVKNLSDDEIFDRILTNTQIEQRYGYDAMGNEVWRQKLTIERFAHALKCLLFEQYQAMKWLERAKAEMAHAVWEERPDWMKHGIPGEKTLNARKSASAP